MQLPEMLNFALSIIASVIATIICVVCASVVSKKARAVITVGYSKIIGVDVEEVFLNKKESAPDIEQELKKAKWIKLFTGRGNELQRGEFAEILSGKQAIALEFFHIIMPSTKIELGQFDWIKYREKELAVVDTIYRNPNTLRMQIESNVKYLAAPISAHIVTLRRYNMPHLYRILLTDRVAYLTPYTQHNHGRATETIKFRGGPMYQHLLRTFDVIWIASLEEDAGHNDN